MAIEIRVPTLGESVTEASIGKWFKQPGDMVTMDEPLVELETDKVTVEIPSPVSGRLSEIIAKEGDTVEVGALLGSVEASAAGAAPARPAAPIAAAATPAAPPAAAVTPSFGTMQPSPSAAKMMSERNLSTSQVEGSGRRGQILKGDVLAAGVSGGATTTAAAPIVPSVSAPAAAAPTPASAPRASSPEDDAVREERVRMTRLRQTIARRLKDVQNTAAMLTTFNEVDMTAVMDLRKRYKDLFEKKHNVKLGFMSFFTKAVCHALKEVPAVNAEIDGTDLIYKNYSHVGIAVGTDRGLVVPVIRNADQMSLADIEKEIGRLGKLARDGKLSVADMQGGTFTITNGGIYGSLMSTPILNAPQSGILGMHSIKERPIAMNGQVVIRPMMYLALSYDHRIVDGAEAVTFLVRIKDCLEDPERLLLDL